MIETKQQQDLYLTAFEEFERSVAETDTPWLRPIRNAAVARFSELSFPGAKHEDWRFTNLAPLLKVPFQLAAEEARGANEEAIKPFVFADCWQLVFVNGNYRPEWSRASALPPGLVLESLATAIEKHGELVEPHLARYARHEELALTALNTAFIKDGAFVHVRNGMLIDKPIHIIHVTTAPDEPRTASVPFGVVKTAARPVPLDRELYEPKPAPVEQ